MRQFFGTDEFRLFLDSYKEQYSQFVCTVLGQTGIDGYIKHLIVLCGESAGNQPVVTVYNAPLVAQLVEFPFSLPGH